MEQHLLSLVLLTPLAGLLVLLFLPAANKNLIRIWANLAGIAGFAASLPLVWRFRSGAPGFQFEEKLDWIPSLGAHYHVGMDGNQPAARDAHFAHRIPGHPVLLVRN